MPNYWIAVSGEANFEKTKQLGFELQGFKARQRRKAERMADGDKLVWYITKEMAFAGYATITGPYFEDHEPIWEGKKAAEDYPWRVPIRKDLVLERDDWIDVEGIARQMAYVSKWPPEHWRLAFQGNLHEIPQEDFARIKAALEQAVAAKAEV
ncbi:MAG TPA: EVE domain-containing protein [Actinomycetota bacterium]|nr:EVE domain-containing protein [Actinomycetota bacterium]